MTYRSKYAAWADEFRRVCGCHLPVRELCGMTTARMVEHFSELTRVRGHVYYVDGVVNSFGAPHSLTKPMPHWWCTTAQGEVVGPTAWQFDGPVRYEALSEERLAAGRRPSKCLNCGALTWSYPSCSDNCSEALHVQYNTRRRSP